MTEEFEDTLEDAARWSDTAKEILFWMMVVVVLVVLSPYWLVKFLWRTATGKNRNVSLFDGELEDGR